MKITIQIHVKKENQFSRNELFYLNDVINQACNAMNHIPQYHFDHIEAELYRDGKSISYHDIVEMPK